MLHPLTHMFTGSPKGHTYSNKPGYKLQVCLSTHNPQVDIMR